MPTRIALKQTKHASKGANEIPRVTSILSDTLEATASPIQRRDFTSLSRSPSPPSRRSLLVSGAHNNSPSKRQVLPSFRSSILRELNVRRSEDGAQDERRMLAAARDDIRASPRLLGYLFSMIAGAVMLASVIQ
jgi:hypothetical protein